MFYLVHKMLDSLTFVASGNWADQFDSVSPSFKPTQCGEFDLGAVSGWAHLIGFTVEQFNQSQVLGTLNGGVGASAIQVIVNGIITTVTAATQQTIDGNRGPNQIFVVGQPGNALFCDWAWVTGNSNSSFISPYPPGQDPLGMGSSGPSASGIRNKS